MSESEIQAIKNLCDQYPFVYSICWHSSRRGTLSEKCYVPSTGRTCAPPRTLILPKQFVPESPTR